MVEFRPTGGILKLSDVEEYMYSTECNVKFKQSRAYQKLSFPRDSAIFLFSSAFLLFSSFLPPQLFLYFFISLLLLINDLYDSLILFSVKMTSQDDAKSIISMQELDPSPVDDSPSDLEDLENGQFLPKQDEPQKRTCGFPSLSPSLLGLHSHRWDTLCKFPAAVIIGIGLDVCLII